MIEPTTVTELDARTPDMDSGNIAVLAGDLAKVHDGVLSELGPDVYVNISASWQGRGGKLITVSVSSADPDFDPDFDDEDDEDEDE